MARLPKKVQTSDVEIMEIHTKQVTFNIVGISPMIMHRFDQKAWRELLLPSQAKNRAEKAMTLKHDPVAEFRGAIYMSRNPKGPTAIHVPSGSFHVVRHGRQRIDRRGEVGTGRNGLLRRGCQGKARHGDQ